VTSLSLDYPFTVGQPVRLLSGPFANQQGMVAKISEDWGSVWVQDRGERVELITQLANLSPVFATRHADSAQRGEEARAEHGTNTGPAAAGNGVPGPQLSAFSSQLSPAAAAAAGPDEEDSEPPPDDVIQSPPL